MAFAACEICFTNIKNAINSQKTLPDMVSRNVFKEY